MKRIIIAMAMFLLAVMPAKAQENTYSKSDFVPGDEIFFEDDLAVEKIGEFPSQWDLLDGIAEVAAIKGRNAIYFPDEGWGKIKPLMKDANFLSDVFTLEYDIYIDQWKQENEEYFEHEYKTVFASLAAEEFWSDGFIGDFGVWYNNNGDASCWWNFKKPDFENEVSGEKDMGLNSEAGRYSKKDNPLHVGWNHIAFSFNKRALKIYINGMRVTNIPSAAAPTRFFFEHSGIFENNGITNIRIAQGAVPLYDRLTSDGKIISYAITFETGKADLKPESVIEINRIAKLMQDNPDISFEVQGHCDNTGSDKINDALSQQRAEAIVAALIKQGIAKNRLTAVGKGSHEPIADNSTDEGRAKNRRVVFVKK